MFSSAGNSQASLGRMMRMTLRSMGSRIHPARKARVKPAPRDTQTDQVSALSAASFWFVSCVHALSAEGHTDEGGRSGQTWENHP